MIDLTTLTIEKAHEQLLKGEYTAAELAQAYLDAIKEKNDELNVYLEVYPDVLEQAALADKKIKEGTATKLTGIPIAIKDNILVRGRVASAASKILREYRGAYDATVTKLLREAGAVLLGRTNMDEFAMGSSTEHSAYGPTKNPVDPSRVPGGSSGGSSAAVAGSLALAALGSDTGGSIRQPAAFCGTVGFMPSYGTVSRYGLMALGSSLDVIGPVAKTVRDAEILWEALGQHDPLDSTSVPEGMRRKEAPLRKKIGVPKGIDGLPDDVRKNFEASVGVLEAEGYEIVELDLPFMRYALPIYYILQPAEASSNLARYDGVRYGSREQGENLLDVYLKTRGRGFGKEVRRRVMLGTYILSHGYYDAYYNKGIALRNQIRRDFARAFDTVDAIVTPTTPSAAFRLGEKADDPVQMYLSDMFTVPANIAGLPAISVPSGSADDGLPLGFHIMGPRLRDDIVLAVAAAFERRHHGTL